MSLTSARDHVTGATRKCFNSLLQHLHYHYHSNLVRCVNANHRFLRGIHLCGRRVTTPRSYPFAPGVASVSTNSLEGPELKPIPTNGVRMWTNLNGSTKSWVEEFSDDASFRSSWFLWLLRSPRYLVGKAGFEPAVSSFRK